MAYKTCENCGSRIFEHGCVNCDEMEYISMQDEYVPPLNSSNSPERSVASELEQGGKADNQKDIEVYVEVEIKEGDDGTLPKEPGLYSIILRDNSVATSRFLNLVNRAWQSYNTEEVTHWLKKVTLSSLLTDNEK